MARTAGSIALLVLVSFATPSSVTASDVTLHALHYCELKNRVSGTGNPTNSVDMADYTPFAFSRMSRQNEPNRFGFRSSTTSAVGIGAQQSDGRWVVRDWAERVQETPKITAVTFNVDNSILVSIYAGENAHVTFGGICEPRELPKQ